MYTNSMYITPRKEIPQFSRDCRLKLGCCALRALPSYQVETSTHDENHLFGTKLEQNGTLSLSLDIAGLERDVALKVRRKNQLF